MSEVIDDLVRRILRWYEADRGHKSKTNLDWENEEIGLEGLQRLIEQKPDRAWEVIKGLIANAPEYALARIGAGPLEDLLDLYGAEFIDRIETYSRQNERMKPALEAMIIAPWVPEEIVERIRLLAPAVTQNTDEKSSQ